MRVGGESVSGYMRSGPGRMRSKVVKPPARACRVSLGTPATASTKRKRISSAAVRQSSSGPKTMKKSSLSPGRTRLRSRVRTACLSGNSGIAAPLSTMGASSRQAMTRTRPRNSSRKVASGCVGCCANAGDARDLHGVDLAAGRQRPPHESQVGRSENIADVAGGHADAVGREQTAAVQLVADLQQVALAQGFVVDQFHGQPGAGHALDLAAISAPHAHVHVLAAGADAGPHAAACCGPRARRAGSRRALPAACAAPGR